MSNGSNPEKQHIKIVFNSTLKLTEETFSEFNRIYNFPSSFMTVMLIFVFSLSVVEQ